MDLCLSGRTIYNVKNGSTPIRIPFPTIKAPLSGLMLVSLATSSTFRLIQAAITLSGVGALLSVMLVG
jgi:hypothetical protein